MTTETYRYVTVSKLLGEYRVIRRSDGKDLGTVRRDVTVGRDAWRAVAPDMPQERWHTHGKLRTLRSRAAAALDALDRAKELSFAKGDPIEYRTAMSGRMAATVQDVSLDGRTFLVTHPRHDQININVEDVALAMESADGLPAYGPVQS